MTQQELFEKHRVLDLAQTAKRKRMDGRRSVRISKLGSARQMLEAMEPGCELYCLTMGQFSLIDVLIGILEITGPADVDLCTWIAAHVDMQIMEELADLNVVRNLRLLLDHNFAMLRKERCQRIEEVFGAGTIRSLATHAKFIRVQNDSWSIAVRTSMNLNQNPRMENVEISDCPVLCEHLKTVVDCVFEEHAPGDFRAGQAALSDLPNSKRKGDVEAGSIVVRDMPAAQKLRPTSMPSMGD